MPSLSTLMGVRIAQIDLHVNQLKYKDVEEDDTFLKTSVRIKKNILLEEIVFQEGQFIDFEYTERIPRLEQQFFGPVSKDVYNHQVRFNFAGTSELLWHSAEGSSYSASDHGVIKPTSNSITVYVELPELNPERAILEGEKIIRFTKNTAENSNRQIKVWNPGVEQRIDEQLAAKREDLRRIFGPK